VLVGGISLLLIIAIVLLGGAATYFGADTLFHEETRKRDFGSGITLVGVGLLLSFGAVHHILLAVFA
jgi:hypothetical protein